VLKLGADLFTHGRSRFSDRVPGSLDPTAKIYVKLKLRGLERPLLAQLDTGAAWSVLQTDVAGKLGLLEGMSVEKKRLLTPLGSREGHLVRLPLTLVADEGESLETEGVFFICRDWPLDLTFLGYSGLLDSIRFALDPQANHFYFGSS
jgi:hypothetical protein